MVYDRQQLFTSSGWQLFPQLARKCLVTCCWAKHFGQCPCMKQRLRDNTMDRQVQQTKHTAMLFTHACALTSTHSSNLVYIIALCMVKSISNMEHASGHIPTSSAVRSSMEQSLPRDARESMYGLWGKAGICASTYASL